MISNAFYVTLAVELRMSSVMTSIMNYWLKEKTITLVHWLGRLFVPNMSLVMGSLVWLDFNNDQGSISKPLVSSNVPQILKKNQEGCEEECLAESFF